MIPRLDAFRQSPDLVKSLADFSAAIDQSGLEKSLLLLVCIRASQLNGCTFCLDMHVKEAKLNGERELRLYHVPAWRESALFSVRERAAFAWTDALTKIGDSGVSDDAFSKAREQYSEKELSDLTFAIMAINAWNRLNVAFHTAPGLFDVAYGLDKAGLK